MNFLTSQELSFIERRTGQEPLLSEAELGASVTSFCAVVDDTILTHLSSVEVSEYTTRPNNSNLYLNRHFSDGSRLTFAAKTEEAAIGSLLCKRSLIISDLGPQRQLGRLHRYEFTPGQLEVIRHDEFRLSGEELRLEMERINSKEYRARAEQFYALPIGEQAKMAGEVLDNTRANMQLAKEMGLNHLPASNAEIVHLGSLVATAQPK